MFNIDEISVPPLSMDTHISDVINLLNIPCTNSSSVQSSSGDITLSSAAHSYSSVAARNSSTNHSKEQLSKFRQSMVAAIGLYVDQSDKDCHSTSFIVFGYLPRLSVPIRT
jgi:hypothetical protein